MDIWNIPLRISPLKFRKFSKFAPSKIYLSLAAKKVFQLGLRTAFPLEKYIFSHMQDIWYLLPPPKKKKKQVIIYSGQKVVKGSPCEKFKLQKTNILVRCKRCKRLQLVRNCNEWAKLRLLKFDFCTLTDKNILLWSYDEV